MENNENNTKEVKSRAIKGEPALVHPCASQWRVVVVSRCGNVSWRRGRVPDDEYP